MEGAIVASLQPLDHHVVSSSAAGSNSDSGQHFSQSMEFLAMFPPISQFRPFQSIFEPLMYLVEMKLGLLPSRTPPALR